MYVVQTAGTGKNAKTAVRMNRRNVVVSERKERKRNEQKEY